MNIFKIQPLFFCSIFLLQTPALSQNSYPNSASLDYKSIYSEINDDFNKVYDIAKTKTNDARSYEMQRYKLKLQKEIFHEKYMNKEVRNWVCKFRQNTPSSDINYQISFVQKNGGTITAKCSADERIKFELLIPWKITNTLYQQGPIFTNDEFLFTGKIHVIGLDVEYEMNTLRLVIEIESLQHIPLTSKPQRK